MNAGRTGRIALATISLLALSLWHSTHRAIADITSRSEQPGVSSRHCIGLLWCTEQSAQGRSVDGLLWLYYAEERGSYSRMAIRPFYSMEEDPAHDLLRRSFLWPLGTYERRADYTWVHVVPFYWHSERPGHEWTFTAPLYVASTDGDVSWRHLFPLISRQHIGDYYTRIFILGPVFISISDTRRDLLQWDFLFPLVHHRADRDSSHTRVAPLYWSGENRASGNSYRYIFPFYGSADSETQHYHFLFPFYGSDVDIEKHTRRLALLGLPPFKGSYGTPTLSLFESATSPDEFSHRLFPLYRYTLGADNTKTFDALLLYRHLSTPIRVADRLLPLWDYGSATQGTAWNLSLLGMDTVALYHHRQTEQTTADRLLLVHDYLRDGDASSLSLLGISELALYRQESSPSLFQHRLFPLYRYRHDLTKDQTEFDAALLYRHLTSPTRVADRLLPFWDYASARTERSWRLSLLGMDGLAWYRHDRDEARTVDHLFPLYGYRSEPDGETRVSALGLPPIDRSAAWSLYEHVTSPVGMSDRLFPLYRYTHDEAATQTTINVVGMEPISLFRSETGPIRTSQHLFPFYRYAANSRTNTTSFSAFWLYWRTASPTMNETSLFPLGGFSRNDDTGEHAWSLIGLDPFIPVSWIRHSRSPYEAHGHFVPIYDYHRDKTLQTLSIGGPSELALYRQKESATEFSRRLFPLFSYSHDKARDLSHTNILIAYGHTQGPDRTIDTLAPLWRYEHRAEQDEHRVNLLGLGTFSLYEHHTTATAATDRVFPLYTYASDLETGDAEFSLLWPLAEYKTHRGRMTSASLLWWLLSYERPDQAHSNFHLLGVSRIALLRRATNPSESIFELNPVIPLFRYRAEPVRGVSWDLFGGLVEVDKTKDQSSVRVLWFLSM